MTVPFFTFGNLSRLREFDLCWASQFLADFGAVARPIRLTAVTTLSLGSWAAVEVLLPPRRAKKDACLTSFFFNYLHGSADMPGKQAAPLHSIRVVGIYARTLPLHELCRHDNERHTGLINLREGDANFVVEFLRQPQTCDPDDRVIVRHFTSPFDVLP